MNDDVVGIIPDENLDDDTQGMGPAVDDLIDEEDLVNADDLDVLAEDAAHVAEDEDFLFEEDDTLGTVKKKRVVDSEVSDEFAELIVDEDEEDDEDDFIGDEDDEARYNFRADEDSLDEGF